MSGVTLNGLNSETTENIARSLKLQTDAPHLVSMGGDRLSTSVTLHPIPQGRVVLGSGPGVDIPVQGTGVSAIHCHIENSENIVTIYPLSDNLSVDGLKVTVPTELSQGSMLTIGRSNYMRFNHPREAKLMKLVLPNPRISMPPICFEHENQLQSVNFFSEPPALPIKSTKELISDIGREGPPSSFLTKISKFEYLAAQNLKKAISPKVFHSNAVTVNTPAKDVLGKSTPNLHNLTKNLPQSALNYSEYNYNEHQKVKAGDQQPISGKKSQYVNITLFDTTTINHRVIIHDNGIKQQNINLNEDPLHTKTSSGIKNINMLSGMTPSPNYNRSTDLYHRSITPNYTLKNVNAIHRRNGSLDQLENSSFYENFEDSNEMKAEVEMKRNQAQQDRIKEQELEKAEQARLEEILNMCAEYENQSQNEKNKPITPNRIKTNGSLPRDKRQQMSQSHFGISTYQTSPPSPVFHDFQKSFNVANEKKLKNFRFPRTDITSNYENLDIYSSGDFHEQEYNDTNYCANIRYQSISPRHSPNSPRTKIKTFVMVDKDNSTKSASNIIENKCSNLETEFNPLHNSNRIKEGPTDNSIESISRKPPSTKFILPLEEIELNDKPVNNFNIWNDFTVTNTAATQNLELNSIRARYNILKKEKSRLLDAVGSLKTLMWKIEMKEGELHREMDMERALLSGEHKAKLLDLEKLQLKKKTLVKQAQTIEDIMLNAQLKQTEHERACQEKLKTAQENMIEIEHKLVSTEKASEDYEAVFEQYLKVQEILDVERKSFEDLEFHHLEEEANWLATREELQREIVDLSIENLQTLIQELEQQTLDTANANNKEYKSLETEKIECLLSLEETRNRLKIIDAKLAEYSDQESEHEMSTDTDSEKAENSDFNNISLKHLSCSIVQSESVLPREEGNNLSHSLNCQLMQDKLILETGIGIQGVGLKRQGVQDLKYHAQQEIRNKLAQRIQYCASTTSTGSEGTGSWEKTDDGNPHSEVRVTLISTDYSDGNRNEDYDVIIQRSLSEISEMNGEGGTFRKRSKPSDKQRPLTRYLPIRGSDLDLRQHIESAGHQVVLCPHVIMNVSSCRGFLHKKGSKLNGWSKRWFVFDRSKHTFSYYTDKNEKRARGGAFFQAIEEIYLDHSKSVKSPNPHLTFIVKTHERYYYLMAPSPEAMRIWVDVIFTGAQGYQAFEPGT